MEPEGHDCFYVLVPVPNNQSEINLAVEGEKIKDLVIKKMEEIAKSNNKLGAPKPLRLS